ncbi:MAG: inosine/xanthosine triphosphatase [Candidatus Hermodarchaeota archaeon]
MSDKTIKVCVGSLNPSKINAVKKAFNVYFNRVQILSIKVDSKVPDQPIGLNNIINGAKNRAQSALSYLIEKEKWSRNIYGVGIEAGLVKISLARTNYMDFQFCVIIDENKNITLGSGIGFEYPPSVINEIFSDKNLEIGDVMGRLANNLNLKNEAGAISYLSKNTIIRTDILKQAVICALLPRINKKLYGL